MNLLLCYRIVGTSSIFIIARRPAGPLAAALPPRAAVAVGPSSPRGGGIFFIFTALYPYPGTYRVIFHIQSSTYAMR